MNTNTKTDPSILSAVEGRLRLILCLVALLFFTVILFPISTFIHRDYVLGDFVTKDIKAPIDFCFEVEGIANPLKEEENQNRKLIHETPNTEVHFVKMGEIIIVKGDKVDAICLVKLNTMWNKVWPLLVGSVCILAALLITFHSIQLKPRVESKKVDNKDLMFLTFILVITLLVVRIWTTFPSGWPLPESHVFNTKFGIPLAVGSMIVCLVLGTEVALPFALICSMAASMLLPNSFEHFVYFYLSSVMAVWWVKYCRERGAIIKAGAKIGLFCVFVAATIDIYLAQSLPWSPFNFEIMVAFVFDGIVAFMGGMSSSIMVLGIVPAVEMIFRYTTDITLLELANLDRPILRRLMLEAPGTYHHSVVVGSMVEAAAAEIGANSLLSKVCGYYHDIGKLKQPLYFVENQLDHRNKHDKLSPFMSSLVLIAHVKHGIEVAKKHKLGGIIVDVIEQHHGNSLISYFFEKAKQIKGQENINVSDFRYPGPRPQTVEAGLVMLADVVEAASRTLVNPTSSRIQGLVQNLINKIFADGQLSNCTLTLKDLDSIARSFNNILSGIYHHRVEYNSFMYSNARDGKSRNAYTNRQQTESSSDTSVKNLQDSSNRLKRLGLS